MALRVVRAGLFDVIQDLGRPGHRSLGVAPAGAFDVDSYLLANALLGNPPGSAALELTLLGGDYLAEIPLGIALAGAPMAATIRGLDGADRSVSIPQSIELEAGEVLCIGSTARGARTYLAVRGGWIVPGVFGSRSSEIPLRNGDRLVANPSTTRAHRPSGPPPPDPASWPIRILDGPDAIGGIVWEDRIYEVSSRSDRMGLRLQGPTIETSADDSRLSSPVAFGTIQVAGGLPMILGPSCGTMGGYPMVAQAISADLPRLGQARPGTRLRFARVTLDEARRLDRERRNRMRDMVLRVATLVGEAPFRPPDPPT